MIPAEIYLKIVRSAMKAPSGHNTQPWLFKNEEDGICIKPDLQRALSIADTVHRELYISLGCAAETARIAAGFYGYLPVLQLESQRDQVFVKLMLQKDEFQVPPDLFSYIAARQTTRKGYDKTPIPGTDLESLKQTITEPGIHVRILLDGGEIGRLAPYITEAATLQLKDPRFKKELIRWMRFSEKEAIQKGDGLYAACLGMPSMGRIAGSLIVKWFVTPGSEAKRLLGQLDRSAAIAIFTSESNDPGSWIHTGMAFQRFALTAAKLNLSHSFVNTPCQVPEVGQGMASEIGFPGEFPQLMIRLGYSDKMHHSFRRRITEVIFHKNE